MPKGNRMHRSALGGFVAVCLCFCLSSEGSTQGNTPAQPAPAEQQQPASPPPPAVQKPVLEPARYTVSCENPKDHDDADLCEQRRQAQAAEDAVWWVRFQTYLGILGAVLVLCSLWFTAVAALAASKAATATEKAVTLARETAIRQLRAYVSVESIPGEESSFADGVLTLPFQLVNRGQTPAARVMQWRNSHVKPLPVVEPLRRARPMTRPVVSKSALGPGADLKMRIEHELPPEQLTALQAGHRLYIWGTVYYLDAFKRWRRTRYQMHCGIDAAGTISAVEIDAKGNETT